MSVMTNIADAIVAELNAATFSQPVTAERHYLPRFDLREMEALHVSVVPKAVTQEMADRTRGQGDYSIDVAVQQKLQTADNAEIDSLTNLVEEIGDHFRGRRLDSYPDAIWVRTEQSILYAPEHLADLRQFTSVVTFTFRVVR